MSDQSKAIHTEYAFIDGDAQPVCGDEDRAALTRPHVLQPCWNAQLAGLEADALYIALKTGLFVGLDDFISGDLLAAQLQLPPVATGYFLELLWATGLLERSCAANTAVEYRTCAALRPYLHPASALYCGDALLFRYQALRQAGAQLEKSLHHDETFQQVQNTAVAQSWAQAARVQIAQEQRAVGVDVVRTLWHSQPELTSMRYMLDLGGGPGLVAITLAGLQPALSGVVFDYPAVATVAQENIQRAGLGNRLQAWGGDLEQDSFGSDYDLIWCASVLHFVPDIPAMLMRLYQALKPGGLLVCCHAEISDDLSRAKATLQYYLQMRMQGRHVLPEGKLTEKLCQAGFTHIKRIDQVRAPVVPVTVLIARKG